MDWYDLINIIAEKVPNIDAKEQIYDVLISALEGCVWDRKPSVMGEDLIFDEVMRSRHSSWFDIEE